MFLLILIYIYFNYLINVAHTVNLKQTLFTAFHHDHGGRQGAIAIIYFFSETQRSKNVEGTRARLCSLKGGAFATTQWHNGQSKPVDQDFKYIS